MPVATRFGVLAGCHGTRALGLAVRALGKDNGRYFDRFPDAGVMGSSPAVQRRRKSRVNRPYFMIDSQPLNLRP